MSDLDPGMDPEELAELVGIGAIAAATALGQLLGRAVQTDDPEEHGGAPQASAGSGWKVAVFCEVEGGLGGWAALLLPASACEELAPILCGMSEPPPSTVESVLREMGNIAVGQAVSAMADVLGRSIATSVPELVSDADAMRARAERRVPGDGGIRYEAELRDRAGTLTMRLVYAPGFAESASA